ncbi:hypothetical protein [Halosegnis sp.]|uniref:hypothetical protein n=1 Tax=Halosegnis sp. TaxID=2864959 RepID=UPI0035D3DA4A
MSSQRRLPPIIDIGDALDRVAAATDDPEATGYIQEIRDGLEELAARPPEARESQVQTLEHLVDSLLTHVDDDAALWAKTIQNRFANYRHARRGSSRTLHVSNGRLEREDDNPLALAGEAQLRGTLINNGEATDAMVSLAFYDETDRAVWKVESREFAVMAGETRELDLTVYVPEGAEYYALAAFEPDDPATVAEDAPTPGDAKRREDGSYVD